jgi:hypothetical protein
MTLSTQRSTCWSITINNPTAADDELVRTATNEYAWIKEIIGQKEVGENGTEHYQLCVRTNQVRFSQLKSVFSRAHIEPARNMLALQKYVVKPETAVSGTRMKKAQAKPSDIYSAAFTVYVPNWTLPEFQNIYPRDFSTPENILQAERIWNAYEHYMGLLPNEFTFWRRLLRAIGDAMILDDVYVEFIITSPPFIAAFKAHLRCILQRTYNAQVTGNQDAETLSEADASHQEGSSE